MHLIFNPYATVLLVFGLITLLLTILLFRRLTGATRSFAAIMVFTSWWAINYGFELTTSNLTDMLVWVNLEYVGISLLPPCWMLFIILYIGKDKWITGRNIFLLFLVPVLTMLIVWTNSLHHLYYTSIAIDTQGQFPMLSFTTGIWYAIFTIYFYLNLAVGSYLLLTSFKKQIRIYKRQKNIILIGAAIPWICNLLYLLGLRPLNHLDLTPFAFIGTSILVCYGLLRFSLFDIIPVAREKIVEALRDGVLVVDMYQRVIDVNIQMKTIFGEASSKKIIGFRINELFPNEQKLHRLISDRENEKIEIEKVLSGISRIYEVDVVSMFEKESTYTGAIILFRDITDRKNTERQLSEQSSELQQANQFKNRLFSIIGHDLRSPMMNLKLLVDMTDSGMITDEEFKSFLPELSKKINYTSSLLENLLYWSKCQLKGQKTEQVVFDLRSICEKEIYYFTQKAKEKGIEIVDLISENIMVFADENMVELVIRNILSNAIKFSSNGDTISLTAAKNFEFIEVCVKDNGSGMHPAQLEKLFMAETFTTRGTNNEQGTGLGLQLCKEFVEKNNGKIWAESEVGAGTSVYFAIPTAPIAEGYQEVAIEAENSYRIN